MKLKVLKVLLKDTFFTLIIVCLIFSVLFGCLYLLFVYAHIVVPTVLVLFLILFYIDWFNDVEAKLKQNMPDCSICGVSKFDVENDGEQLHYIGTSNFTVCTFCKRFDYIDTKEYEGKL